MKNILIAILCCLPLISFAESEHDQANLIQSFIDETAGHVSNGAKAPGYSGKTFTTHNAGYVTSPEGWVSHIADYGDGTRIVTAINGDLQGYQIVGYNGRLLFDSWNIEVHNGYFIHYYPNAKVVTHDNKQQIKYY